MPDNRNPYPPPTPTGPAKWQVTASATVSLIAGLGILGWETVVEDEERVTLLIIAYALITGSPLVGILERFRGR